MSVQCPSKDAHNRGVATTNRLTTFTIDKLAL